MKCKVEGCDREAVYKEQCVCQMHYFRMMRNGKYELEKTHKSYYITPNGYRKIYKPNHQLADRYGYIFEHRYNLFEKYNGKALKCEFCGAYWNWRPYLDHVDHIDENRLNNDLSNLRPLCNACNTRRTRKEEYKAKGRTGITYDGITKTAAEWARDERVDVCGAQIIRRLNNGMSVEEALLKPSRTKKRD